MKSLALLVFICWAVWGIAQKPPLIDDSHTMRVLVFENLDKGDSRFIKEGGTVKYKLRRNDKVTYKGVIDKITDKTMIVDGHEITLSDCSMIAGRVRTGKELAGGIAMGVGFPCLVLGGTVLSTAVSVSVGIPLVGLGAVSLVVGITMMMNKKRFNLNKGWDVYGGKIIFNRAAALD